MFNKPVRILLVDDDEMIRKAYRILLSCNGFSVTAAKNGHDALDKARSREFDLVITDINMPLMDGISFYLLLLKEQPHLKKRTIFISGKDLKMHDLQGVEETELNFILKPCEVRELLRKIEGVLRMP